MSLTHEQILATLSLPQTQWEAGLIGVCLLLAGLIARQAQQRALSTEGLSTLAQLGRGGMRRLVFPLSGIGLLLLGRLGYALFDQTPYLIGLGVALLAAMALIRTAVYILRQAFAPSAWLLTFERFFATLIWTVWMLHALDVLPEVVDWLDAHTLAVGKQKLSLWTLLQGSVWVVLTLVAALWLSGAAERRLMRTEGMDSNLRIVLARLVKVVLIVLSIMISLPLVGIDLTALSVFGGALGVGLGFGMQKIMANYVSGFIILIERSIRIGDLIEVSGQRGQVTQITTRYTVLRSMSGVESIVPNETLIGSTVQNEAYTDHKVRVSLQVQVGYDSDVEQAMAVLSAAAARHPRVLAEPAPRAYLHSFGDSGINLELGFWIADPEQGTLEIRSTVQLAVLHAFRAQGIEIPYPQRELRMHGAAGTPDTAAPSVASN